jgi:hypothetical protein
MLARRYPHAEAGKAVSPLFAIGGAAGGVVSSRLMSEAPPVALNAVLWAAIAGMTAFLVFSSEGPRPRPEPLWQAAMADGVVAGIIATVSASILDLFLGSGSGSTSSSVTVSTFGTVVGVGVLVGLVAGAFLGLAVLLISGPSRLARARPEPRRKRQSKRKKRR